MEKKDTMLVPTTSVDKDSPLARAQTQVPVSFLLELHNSAPMGSEIRRRIIDTLKYCAALDAKAHWARGLVQSDSGDLLFDENRYEQAVYRGKQDTYAKSAQKAFDELQRALATIARAQHSELMANEIDASTARSGKPLVDFTIPTGPAALLKTAAHSLPGFVERMAGGIDVAVTGESPMPLGNL
jgi:hypothetical protein